MSYYYYLIYRSTTPAILVDINLETEHRILVTSPYSLDYLDADGIANIADAILKSIPFGSPCLKPIRFEPIRAYDIAHLVDAKDKAAGDE